VEENLLTYNRPTGSAVDAKLRTPVGVTWAWRRRSPGRASRAALATAAAGLVVLAGVSGAAAAGLALLALVAAVLAYGRPYLIAPLVAVLLPAAHQLDVLHAQVSPLEAAVGGAALGYVARLAARREERRFDLVHWTFAAFVIFIGVSTLGPADNSDQLRLLLFWGALGFVFHAVTTHLRSAREVRLLFGGLAAATLVEASLALYEYVDRWSERFWELDGAIVFPLPRATLEHPNGLAQFLVLAAFVVLALALADRRPIRVAGLVVMGVAALALIVTFSRASWIAFAAGSAVYLLDRRSRIPVVIAGGVAVVGSAALALLDAGAIGARVSSIFTAEASGFSDFRIELAERAARAIADHPLTGPGQFVEVGVYAGRPDVATHPHNLFLGLAVFFGIPAALAFAALVLLALRSAWRGYSHQSGSYRLTAVGCLAFLVAMLVNGLFEYPFWNPALAALVVLGLAACFALERAGPRASEPGSQP
jgi:O-antigen ligase